MRIHFAALPIILILGACAPAQRREPLYGPSPLGVASNDPKEIADQISSVNAQITGTEAQITSLDSKITAMEHSKQPNKDIQLANYLDQRGTLESRHSALLTRRTSLQSLSNSEEGRTTVPLQ